MKTALTVRIKKANAALFEQGELEAIPDYFSPAYVVHLTGHDLAGGHDLIRSVVTLYRKAFPDLAVTLDILAVQGERVAWQRTMCATHQGAFKGFPATQRRMVWREMITSRFQNGLIVEEWFLTDLAEQLLLARKVLKK